MDHSLRTRILFLEAVLFLEIILVHMLISLTQVSLVMLQITEVYFSLITEATLNLISAILKTMLLLKEVSGE
jgi:hypothetical protein